MRLDRHGALQHWSSPGFARAAAELSNLMVHGSMLNTQAPPKASLWQPQQRWPMLLQVDSNPAVHMST